MKLKDMNEIFRDDLRDPGYSAGYLNISLEEEGIEGFLYALQKVARAHGISDVAERSELSRESLYRALSSKGNPGIRPMVRMLDSLGLQLAVIPSASESAQRQQEIEKSYGSPDHNASVDGEQLQTSMPSELAVADLYRLIIEEFKRIREENAAIQQATQLELADLKEDLLGMVSRTQAVSEGVHLQTIDRVKQEYVHTEVSADYLFQDESHSEQMAEEVSSINTSYQQMRIA